MFNKEFIKKRLNEELATNDTKKVVGGVLIKALDTGNVLLLYRNDKTPTWALVSGGIDKGESPLEGLKREVYEEMFANPNKIDFKFIRVEHIPEKNLDFFYYEGFVDKQFSPILDGENLNYGWFPKDKLPSPLYKGLDMKIAKI